MGEPYLGEIKMTGFSFPPKNWAQCDGQVLPINDNTALFALLGTAFGGNGTTNFALPDMRGRTPMHTGTGFFNDYVTRGQKYGYEKITLQHNELPSHTHDMYASTQPGTKNAVGPNSDRVFAEASAGLAVFGPETSLSHLSAATTTAYGGDQAHGNVQPSLVINFVIALQGIFPSRN